MSDGGECIVSLVEAANRDGSRIRPAIDMITASAEETRDAGLFAITCGKCGVELTISTEIAEDRAQLMLRTPASDTDEACATTQYRKEGDWVTNLGKRWFRLSLLENPDTEYDEDNKGVSYAVSKIGVEAAVEDAAIKVAQAQQAKEGSVKDPRKARELEIAATTAITVLDLILVRQDSKTWQDEIEKRSILEFRE